MTIAPNLDGVSSLTCKHAGKNLAPVNDFTAQRQTVMTFDTPLQAGIYSYSYLATRTGSDSRNGGFRFIYNDDTYLNEYLYVDEGTRSLRDGVVFAKPVKSIYVYSISGSYADSGNFTVTVDDFQFVGVAHKSKHKSIGYTISLSIGFVDEGIVIRVVPLII